MDFEPVIGLETHVQLRTRSKMWCGCANSYGAAPNTHVCPVCLGLPGVLPVPNEEALRLTALTGLLLHCSLPRDVRFDRKSYFYPDMPKNYQLTQYARPSTLNGWLEFECEGQLARVRINRAHLEEDVGKSFHFERQSGLDFNRAGVPLMEIVTEPDITSAAMAQAYLNALKEVLIQGGISDCDMEKGMVRCDVNISVRPQGSPQLGAKIEIKNMNSFSGVRRALEYEIERQIDVVKRGGRLIQSTRRWDDDTGITEEMRTKEDAHDYRYLPCPDLMPVQPDEAWFAAVQARVVESPLDRKARLMREYQLPAGDAEGFKADPELSACFESVARGAANPKAIANWMINTLRARMAVAAEAAARAQIDAGVAAEDVTPYTLRDLRFAPMGIRELVEMVDSGRLSNKIAQEVFADMFETGEAPRQIVERKGLVQVSDTGALEAFCDQAIAANPGPVADFKSGKAAALNFLKGQVMKLSKGKANPAVIGDILQRKLSA